MKFLFLFLFSTSILHAQGSPGYVLVKKADPSQNSRAFEWIATNSTSTTGNFYILDNLTAHSQIFSITGSVPVSTNPSLPIVSSGPLTVGPFQLSSNASITFHVSANLPAQASAGDSFILLSESQSTGKKPKDSFANSSSQERGTAGSTGLIRAAQAQPNVSNGNQPIDFHLDLNTPAHISLSLFTVAGEEVYSTQMELGQGVSNIVWNLQNNNHQQVSSGLYIFYLKAAGVGTGETKTGKVLILH